METPSNGFDEFWKIYPRRVDKQAAAKAFAKALKSATLSEVLCGARRYANERQGQDAQFTKHAATWLNGRCWENGLFSGIPAGGETMAPPTIHDRVYVDF